MPKAKKTLTQQVKELKAENARLKRKLSVQKSKGSRPLRWRTPTIVVLAGVAGAILISANLVFWTARTLVETDRYTDATQSLIKKPAVQKAIADKTTEAIFTKVDVTALLEETLPPRVQFAAPSLAAQIETFTNNKANKLLASKEFEHVWVNTNQKAHERFIEAIRNYKGDGTINISDIYAKLAARLENTKLAFLQNVTLPSKIGSIQVIDAPWLRQANYVVVNLDTIRLVTILLFVVLTAAAVAIAKNRRRVTISVGIFFAVLMAITLVAVRISREVLVAQVDPRYQRAAIEAYQAVFNPFVSQTIAIMSVGVAVALVAWLAWPSKDTPKLKVWATRLLKRTK